MFLHYRTSGVVFKMATVEKLAVEKDSADGKNEALPRMLLHKKEEESLRVKMARTSLKSKLQP